MQLLTAISSATSHWAARSQKPVRHRLVPFVCQAVSISHNVHRLYCEGLPL